MGCAVGECLSFSKRASDRITIQKPVEVADDYGSVSTTWQDVGQYWAEVTPLNAREIFAQQAVQSRANFKFMIRWQSSFKDTETISKYRIYFDEKFYAITGIHNFSTDLKTYGKDYQIIYAEEGGLNA